MCHIRALATQLCQSDEFIVDVYRATASTPDVQIAASKNRQGAVFKEPRIVAMTPNGAIIEHRWLAQFVPGLRAELIARGINLRQPGRRP